MTRQRLILAGAVLLALLGSFGVGRYSRHPAVVHDETHATTDTHVNDKLALAMAELVNAKRDLATWQAKAMTLSTNTSTITRWLPAVPAANGCPAIPAHVEQVTTAATRSEERDQGGTKEVDASQRSSNLAAKQDHQADQHQAVFTLHTAEDRPNWSVSILPGVDLTGRSSLPYHAVVGASVERRILGPLFLGLHGNSAGVVGAIVRMEF